MTTRNFNNTSTVGQLQAGVTAGATVLSVSGFSNYPAVPFTITVDRNGPTEEICLVTLVNTTNLTVTRGYNGTAAQAHTAGNAVEHTAVALDFTEANAHVYATSGVHGVTGSAVGTDGAQTLLAKTLISPVVTADATAGDAIVANVPSSASARNLFRGIGPSGSDVVTIGPTGTVTAPYLHSTGTVEADGNGQIDGNLTVTGTSTLTGNTAVGGTLTATGAATLNGGATVPTGKALTVNGTTTLASATVTGATTTGTVRITSTGDASATSTTHGLQIGADTSLNIIIDNNEILGRNNGVLAPIGFGAQRLVSVGDPAASSDAATRGWVEARSKWGATNVTIDSSGNWTLNHGFGTTPSVGFVHSRFAGAVDTNHFAVTSITSTQLIGTAFYNGGKAGSGSTPVYFFVGS